MTKCSTLPDSDDEIIVLASASPRRRELLTQAGVKFRIVVPDICERRLPGEDPETLVKRLARQKAWSVAEKVGNSPRTLVLGSDTVVALDGEIFGKPRDPEHAVELLGQLVGHTHRVISGIAVVDSAGFAVQEAAVTTRVTMRGASRAEIRAYVATGEPLDKAGAYAIQGRGGRLVTGLEGSWSCVVGLPVEETLALLEAARDERAKEPK
jgi:septum formation protein